MKRLASVALCCFALSNGPAHAGLFDDVEARKQIDVMNQELRNVRQELDAVKKNGVELEARMGNQLSVINQLETLKQEVAKLRGMAEVSANSTQQADKRLKDFYIDLDARLRKLEGATVAAATQSAPVATAEASAETKDYQAALDFMRANKALDAAFGLRTFVLTYPKSKLLPGANFWLAAAYAQLGEHESARETYAKMASTWPDDPLAPDAMLGEATAQQSLKATKGARTTLEALVAKYPNSDAAKTAKARLAKK